MMPITVNNILKFECTACHIQDKSTDEDTLRFEEIKKDQSLHEKLIKTFHYDAANPRTFLECQKCHHNVAIFIRLGENFRRIFRCEKCGSLA